MLVSVLLLLLVPTLLLTHVVLPRLAPSFVVEPPSLVQYMLRVGVRVRCEARGDPPPLITWLGEDLSPLEDQIGIRRVYKNGTLEVFPRGFVASVSAGIRVRCRAANAHGVALSRDVTLQPVLEESWEAVVRAWAVAGAGAAAGGAAVLWCGAEPDLPLVRPVAWYRGEQLLDLDTPTPESRYLAAAGGWLLVRDPTPTDTGPYACLARHSLSDETRRSGPALLHLASGSVAVSAPRLATTPREIVVPQGSAFCLACTTSDHPPPHYSWYRAAGGRLEPVEVAVDVWLWAGGAALCVQRARPHHSGTWLCKAYNVYGESAAQHELRVTTPLSVTVEPSIAVAAAGSAVRLNCSSSGAEGAALSWLHDGVAVGSGGVLVLRGVSRAHRGLYQCFARTATDTSHADAELRLGESAPELQYGFIEQALRGGGTVSLRCAALGTPPPALLWLRDEQPLNHQQMHDRYSISEERSPAGELVSVLNISSVTAADGGRYSCRATNRLGTAHHSARLNIYGPPSVRALGPARLLAGANATLYCPYAGYPISSVTWSRGAGAALAAAGRVAARGAELRLWPALPRDAGRYTCTVTAPAAPPARASLDIQVRNPPKISPFLFSSELTEGSSAQVLCGVSSGDKPLYFSWLKDGGSLPSDLQIEEKSLSEFSLLVFPELTARHSGDYTCRVSNHAATLNYTAALNVKVAPAWTREPADAAVVMGAPLLLQCAASGHPEPSLTWFRKLGSELSPEGGEQWEPVQSDAGSLRIDSASRELHGEYRCAADNGVGAPLHKLVRVTVHEPARVEGAPRNVSAARGAPAELWCSARGDAPLALRWTHRGLALDPDSYRWSVSESRTPDGLRSTLKLRAADRSDAGEYRCHAHNPYGRANLPLYLHIDEPPNAPIALMLAGLSGRWARITWRGVTRDHLYTALCTAHPSHAAPAAFTRNITVEPSLEHREDAHGYMVMSSMLEGLRPAVRYSLRLTATNYAGKSSPSDPLTFTTLEEPPAAPPQNVRVRTTDVSGELLVSWSAPALESWNSELIGYVVSWREVGDAGTEAGRGGGEGCARGARSTGLAVRGLRGGARYAVTVRAYSVAGVSPPAMPVYASTPDSVPEKPPEAVSCDAIGVQELRVRWSPAASSSTHSLRSYDVHLIPIFTFKPWEHLDAAPRVQESAAAGELRVRGLRAATNYSVWVRARNELGAGPFAAPAHCTTLEDVPAAVRGVRAVPVDATAVLVAWEAPAPRTARLTHYILYTRELGKASSEWSQRVDLEERANAEAVWREVRGLREHVVYEFWVVAGSAGGAGAPSRTVAATPAHIPVARITWAPRAVLAAAGSSARLRCVGAGSPPLRWRWAAPPTAPPAARLLSLSDSPELLLHKAQISWTGNYTCSVRNAVGGDSARLLLVVVGPSPAPAPRLLRADMRALHLAWDAPPLTFAPVLSYSVQWSLGADGVRQRESRGERTVPVGDTTLLMSGLRCGALYSVTMRAHSALGASPLSAPLSARTLGDRAVALPGKEVLWVNSTALRVNLLGWGMTCPVDRWHAVLRRPGTTTWTALPLDAYSAHMDNLHPGSWYEVRVTADSTAGETVALYRVATLTFAGERIGEAVDVSIEERRIAVGGGESVMAPDESLHSQAVLVSGALGGGVAALLVALAGVVVVRRRRGRGREGVQERVPLPQLYTMEPGKRTGKALTPQDEGGGKSGEISPYATFNMSAPLAPPAPHRHRARSRPPLLLTPAPLPITEFGTSERLGRDSDSESSESPCAACADQQLHRRHWPRRSGTLQSAHGSGPTARYYTYSPHLQSANAALRTAQ